MPVIKVRIKSRQTLFNNAWKGLKAQGWRQARDLEHEVCMYRAVLADGTKACCAIGHSISDKTYAAYGERALEQSSVTGMNSANIQHAAGIRNKDVEFARELQRVHDTNKYAMEERMRMFAERYRLAIPE